MAKNLVSIFRQVIDGYMESFETAFPGIVKSVNSDGTVNVTPSVRNCLANMQLQNGGGEIGAIPDVPVLYPGTATALVKFEIKAGDPVLLVASSRDLAAWASGKWEDGPFNPLSFDGNDLNDLMALPVRRLDHKEKPKATITISASGSISVESSGNVDVKAENVKIDASKATITGDLSVNGAIDAGGNIDSKGSVSAMVDVSAVGGAVKLSSHTHLFPAQGGAPTSPPVPV